MKYIISYSGGLGSFMAAYLCRERYGAENCVLLFADTNTEDEDLYRFVDETVAFLGIEFVRLDNDGKNIWDAFTAAKFMGNSRVDPCSRNLKRIPLDRWDRGGFCALEGLRAAG
jgi:3'-phosphoadenosine 5'-phosphosulfate sulfotransferase (PAPS reductase)/FAD synthetase